MKFEYLIFEFHGNPVATGAQNCQERLVTHLKYLTAGSQSATGDEVVPLSVNPASDGGKELRIIG